MNARALITLALVIVLLPVGYVLAVTQWSYSSGERAGWVQQFSNKGWLCKTWEGEMAMVSPPGSTADKFYFTVSDDAVATQVMKSMGKRVALQYEQKIVIPTRCFGDTRYYITGVVVVAEPVYGAGAPTPPVEKTVSAEKR
jgi:hypothetical protein